MPTFVTAVVCAGLVVTASSAYAQAPQASAEPSTVKTPDQGQWMAMPDLFPKGAEMQVLNGDPAKGAADFYFRVPVNYTFPWHFHTPVEKVFVDAGSLKYEPRTGATQTLEPGDYVYVPARSPHRVTCTGPSPCQFFLSSSGPFDINLVDENWTTTKTWRADGGTTTRR